MLKLWLKLPVTEVKKPIPF